ncbi:FtsX-like permease family protein [Candidatus Calescamantes bacterium]|nr:FtsX-like permease family protein [Candidatus Calescamantes bacterium]
MSQEKVGRQIVLPFSVSLKISFNSMRIRLGRSFITIMGILLAIAFLMSILAQAAIQNALILHGSPSVTSKIIVDETTKARMKWLVSLSLLVCVVGITNSMLMSVTERYREIGTMKCLGALDSFVVRLFLLESLFQGVAGSLIGIILGTFGMTLVSAINYGGEVFRVFPWVELLRYMLFSFVVGIILATVGAIYPAYRAARMVPAEAMRREE